MYTQATDIGQTLGKCIVFNCVYTCTCIVKQTAFKMFHMKISIYVIVCKVSDLETSNNNWQCYIVSLDMKGCICHFTKWQIHPFISKGTIYQQAVEYMCLQR